MSDHVDLTVIYLNADLNPVAIQAEQIGNFLHKQRLIQARPPSTFSVRGYAQSSSIFNAAMNASCGISTFPNWRIRFFPSFCLSSSFRFRDASPP